MLHIKFTVGIIFRESKGQSAAMPACTLAFASLCLQNALLLLKSAEVIPVHEPESVLESQLAKEDDTLSQETDASRYVWFLEYSCPSLLEFVSLWITGN